MFHTADRSAENERRAAHSALVRLLESRDDWYDGTPVSIDRRIANVRSALADTRRLAERDMDMMVQAESLASELNNLYALRNECLSARLAPRRTLPRLSSIGQPSSLCREFIAHEIGRFLADNSDALDDPDELDTRAEDHAERKIENYQLPVTEAQKVVAHFRLAVDWSARNARRRPTRNKAAHSQPTRLASVADLPDDVLFD